MERIEFPVDCETTLSGVDSPTTKQKRCTSWWWLDQVHCNEAKFQQLMKIPFEDSTQLSEGNTGWTNHHWEVWKLLNETDVVNREWLQGLLSMGMEYTLLTDQYRNLAFGIGKSMGVFARSPTTQRKSCHKIVRDRHSWTKQSMDRYNINESVCRGYSVLLFAWSGIVSNRYWNCGISQARTMGQVGDWLYPTHEGISGERPVLAPVGDHQLWIDITNDWKLWSNRCQPPMFSILHQANLLVIVGFIPLFLLMNHHE